MKRKAIIGIVLALVVGVVLGLALRWEDERPPLRFTYLGLSPTNTNHVVFRVTKIDTNFMCVLMLDEQIADDIWESQTNPPPQLIQAFDHFEETPNLPVPLTTNLWRPTAYFYRAPNDTFLLDTRLQLSVQAAQAGLFSVSEWLNPLKLQTICGPVMRGNKPVEKK